MLFLMMAKGWFGVLCRIGCTFFLAEYVAIVDGVYPPAIN